MYLRICLPVILLLFCPAAAAGADVDIQTVEYHLLRAETDKSFQDVSEELEFAITERNYRITGRNVIGKALRKRGYEDFFDVDVIHFCNVQNAREVLVLDPSFVIQMPCRILLHEEGDKTIVHAVLLPEDHADERVNVFARRINAEIRAIVDFALEEYQ